MTSGTDRSLFILIVRVLLAVGLIGGLLLAGLSIYRRMPEGAGALTAMTRDAAASGSRLVVRKQLTNATLHSPLEFYHFNLDAAQREYDQSPKLAKQFDDFLARRMHDITPVRANVNGDGFATVQLTPGDWWLRATATSDTGEEIEWRLPFAMNERDQTIELSVENAYERRKKF